MGARRECMQGVESCMRAAGKCGAGTRFTDPRTPPSYARLARGLSIPTRERYCTTNTNYFVFELQLQFLHNLMINVFHIPPTLLNFLDSIHAMYHTIILIIIANPSLT